MNHIELDSRVIDVLIKRRRGATFPEAARAAHSLGFRYLSWLYLLEVEATQ